MREIVEILKQIDQLADGEKAVLATVVDLKGSGYRLPGARMLIKANGDAVGTVSGGCLEADILERSRRVLSSGQAEVFTYDTTADEQSVFSLNMGCRGVLRILLESVERSSDIIAALRDVRFDRKAVVSAALISVSAPMPAPVGSRVFLPAEGSGPVTDKSGLLTLIPALHDDLMTFSGAASTETISYEAEGGVAELAYEMLSPPVRLLILGAGADAVPLADAAWALGWQTSCADHRPAFIDRRRFPNADELIRLERDAAIDIDADPLTAVVLMNHNYDRDKAMLPAALRSAAFYVGALGPKRRTQQIIEELAAAGETFTDAEMEHLRSPAGLDIGADTPEAIAVSMIAEIQSVLKRRPGGPLRDRQAPIYDRRK